MVGGKSYFLFILFSSSKERGDYSVLNFFSSFLDLLNLNMASTLLLHDLQWLTIASPGCFVAFPPSLGHFSLALPIWTMCVFFSINGSQRLEQEFSR